MNIKTAFTAKLKESRIPPKLAEQLGLRTVDSAQSVHASFHDLPAIEIPYPLVPGYSRVRYLGPAPDDVGKYANPAGQPTHPYQQQPPPDDTEEAFITEGELKSIAAQHWLGDHWIGLVGVWNFATKDDYHQKQLEPELLALFELPNLSRITIIFDYAPIGSGSYFDVRKAAVRLVGALQRTAEQLGRRDIIISNLDTSMLPGVEHDSDAKWGIDDWIARSLDAGTTKQQLQHAFDHALERFCKTMPWDINDGVAYSLDRFIYDEQNALPFDRHYLRHRTVGEFQTSVGGRGFEAKGVAIWNSWNSSFMRTSVPRVYYEYGKPTGLTADGFNLYTPPPHVLTGKNKVDRLHKLIETVANHDGPAVHQYIENWLAHTIQSTERAHTSLALTGMKGTGKSQLGRLMAAVLMDEKHVSRHKRTALNANVRRLTRSVLDSRFWLAGLVHSRLLLLDESLFEGRDAITLVDRVKSLITDDVQLVEPKGKATYDAQIHFNLMMTSNDPDLVRLFGMQDERRFLNVWGTLKQTPEWYAQTEAWIEGPDCGPAVYQHLSSLDISSFNPRVIPETAHNEGVAEQGTNQFEAWLYGKFGVRGQYVNDFRAGAPLPDQPVIFWRVPDVQRVYEQETKQRASAQLVGRAFHTTPWITCAAKAVTHTKHPVDGRPRDNIYAFDGKDYSPRKPAWVAQQWATSWVHDMEDDVRLRRIK